MFRTVLMENMEILLEITTVQIVLMDVDFVITLDIQVVLLVKLIQIIQFIIK